jgi:hypothetical protein
MALGGFGAPDVEAAPLAGAEPQPRKRAARFFHAVRPVAVLLVARSADELARELGALEGGDDLACRRSRYVGDRFSASRLAEAVRTRGQAVLYDRDRVRDGGDMRQPRRRRVRADVVAGAGVRGLADEAADGDGLTDPEVRAAVGHRAAMPLRPGGSRRPHRLATAWGSD